MPPQQRAAMNHCELPWHTVVFSSAQVMMEDVNVCRSCDHLEHFHHLDVEHAPLAIDKLLSHSCGRDQTGETATPREEIPHNHQFPELIAIAPLPTESVTNSHSVAAQTNGHNYHLVVHGTVARLSAELLVNTPEKRANYAWDRNPDVHNHIICFCKSSADGAAQVANSSAEGLQKT